MSLVKRVSLGIMAIFYVFAGVMHFVRPEFYMKIMPDYLPLSWHLPLVYLSGVAEVVLGLAVLIPATRQLAAWGLIALLIAVFPANLYAAMNDISPTGGDPGIANWVRLPFQAVFIAWAWWYTRPEPGES